MQPKGAGAGRPIVRILVAEDNEVGRKVMEKMLGRYGRCDLVENGRQAIDTFATALRKGELYDLIFLDIMMPELDGKVALREIRALEREHGVGGRRKSTIFMLTALSDSRSVLESFALRCDGYIIKPVDRRKLEAQLAAAGVLAGL